MYERKLTEQESICDVILFIIGLEIKNKKQKLNSINDTIIKEKS